MTQRNPMNERYNREDLGQTRKSAASAKPVAKAHASVYVEGSSSGNDKGIVGRAKKRANKKVAQSNTKKGQSNKQMREPTREEKRMYYDPDTPEYKKWRRNWWITIVVALVLTVGSFVLQTKESLREIAYVVLACGYFMLFVAIYIDIAKVRKIRKNYTYKMANSKTKAAKRERKRAEQEALAEQASNAEKLAAEKNKRAEKYKNFPLIGKKAEKSAQEAQVYADQTEEAVEKYNKMKK